jgi:hypothetical protein
MKTDRLIVPLSEFNLILDFMPEFNRPTGGGTETTIDWNTLMPVVEKIEDENPGTYFRIYRKKCIVRTMKSLIVFQKEVSATRIEAVYKAVVEFIKWYNENKKS